jgi:spermidine/putrescine ABC transporter ATP-binding subunit
MNREPAVRVTGIHRTFGHVQALRGVSFDVGEGEFLVLLGPSGSGKTTILRVIAGFEELTEGAVVIRGRPVADVPPNRRDIGVVFQHFALFPHLTVFRNVAFGLEMRRVPRKELRARVIEALDMVRLVGLDDRMPNQLSGGQQQRVALARALVTRPAVLLLDEPLGSLDPHLRAEMQVEIRRLQQTLAISAIMVTHDQEEAMTMADRIAILHEGQLQQIGTPREIYGAPASAFVARFIGAANVFDVVDVSAHNGVLKVSTKGGLTLTAMDTQTNPHGGNMSVVVRPENVYFGLIPANLENVFRGRVTSITYMGAVTRCQVAIGDNLQLTATVPTVLGHRHISVGEEVSLGWPAASTMLVANR